MRIQERVDAHQRINVQSYIATGNITEYMWAESDEGVALLKPLSYQATKVSDFHRAQMIAVAAKFTGFNVIGRSDLLFARHSGYLIKMNNQDQLSNLSEIDPTIVRTLLVHAIDTRTTETCESVAYLTLDNDGLPYWNFEFDSPYAIQLLLPLYAASRLVKQKRFRLANTEQMLAKYLRDNNWAMSLVTTNSEARRIV